jgi:hypothetical protein
MCASMPQLYHLVIRYCQKITPQNTSSLQSAYPDLFRRPRTKALSDYSIQENRSSLHLSYKQLEEANEDEPNEDDTVEDTTKEFEPYSGTEYTESYSEDTKANAKPDSGYNDYEEEN